MPLPIGPGFKNKLLFFSYISCFLLHPQQKVWLLVKCYCTFVAISSLLCISVLFLLQTTNLLMLECVHGNRCFIVVVIMMIEDVCKENSLTSQCKVILFDFQSLPQKIHQVFLPCLHFEFSSSTSVWHSGSVTRCLFSANSSWWRVEESANFVKK